MIKLEVGTVEGCKVATSNEVEGLASQGYRPVYAFEEERFQTVRDEWGNSTRFTSPEKGRAHCFLMVRGGENELIESLRKEAADASRRAKVHYDEKVKVDLEAVALRSKLAKVEETLTAVSNVLEKSRRDLSAAEDRNRRMEIDLAKIRQALGELRMKEILGT